MIKNHNNLQINILKMSENMKKINDMLIDYILINAWK